jgi:hypothetical protein
MNRDKALRGLREVLGITDEDEPAAETDDDTYNRIIAELEGNSPDTLAFRAAWEALADAGRVDMYGGAECRREYAEWVSKGKPTKDGAAVI